VLAHSSGDGEWAFLCAFCRPRKNRSVVGSFRPWGVELRCGTDLGQRLPQGDTARAAPTSTPTSRASDKSVRPTWALPSHRSIAFGCLVCDE
jgi:hypothetical protein